jgi:hypothetical protein
MSTPKNQLNYPEGKNFPPGRPKETSPGTCEKGGAAHYT